MAVTRLGSNNGATADLRELFQKKYAHEVMTAYNDKNVMRALHEVRTLQSGKSMSFPVLGNTSAQYHAVGTALSGTNTILHGEVTVNVDNMFISDIQVARIDEVMNDYDVRRYYADKQGQALSIAADKRMIQAVILAARSTSYAPLPYSGYQGVLASCDVDGNLLHSMILECAKQMDIRELPETDRHGLLRPAQWYLLQQLDKIANRDYNGGVNVIEKGLSSMTIAGINFHKTNHVPNSVIAAVAGENNTYSGTFTNTVCPIFHRDAIVTVEMKGLEFMLTGTDYEAVNQATLMVARQLQGTGIRSAMSACEIRTA